MGKLIDDVRRAIQVSHDSGVSRYVLANRVGVSQSALSKFMSGKQGLTLASLERLADVLGIEVVVRMQHVPVSAPRGRKRKELSIIYRSSPHWPKLAAELAQNAYEKRRASHRGAYYLPTSRAICVYNNHPYAAYPRRRDEERESLCSRLGMPRFAGLLAYATYPPDGRPNAGYSYAMIVAGNEGDVAKICEEMRNILDDSEARIGESRLGTATRSRQKRKK